MNEKLRHSKTIDLSWPKNWYSLFFLILIVGLISCEQAINQSYDQHQPNIGDAVDSLNGVYVYYNGQIGNVSGRNLTTDNYNLGLKYQCVEFVKRYYYEFFDHKMPDSWGHAKDFFEPGLMDGVKNKRRNLIQFRNPSESKPETNDLIVFKGNSFNPYGHVAIIANVEEHAIEIIQQNPGPLGTSRETLTLVKEEETWKVGHSEILGWLRKEE